MTNEPVTGATALPGNSRPRERVLLVPDVTVYLAFRQLPILAAAGLTVDVLCLQGSPVAFSRYVAAVEQVPTLEALVARVREVLDRGGSPWVKVMVTNEAVVRRLVSTAPPEVLAWWQPGISAPGVREFLRDKEGLMAARERWGLPIPEARCCRRAEEVADFCDSAGCPVIIKPLDGYGGHGLRLLEGRKDLDREAGRLSFPLLAQVFIRGRRGVVDMLCSGGRPIAWLTSHSSRRLRGEFSTSTGRDFAAMPELEPMIRQVASATQFDGFCGFDWMVEDGTGRLYLIEFHARAPSGFRFWRDCGVDFASGVRHWLGHGEMPSAGCRQPAGRVVRTAYFPIDLKRCLASRDWDGLRAWLPGSGYRHDFPWDDLPLMAGWIAGGLGRTLARSVRRRGPDAR